MRNFTLTLFFVLSAFKFSFAQIYKLYNEPKTNKFTYLSRDNQTYTNYYQLFEIEFSGRISNSSFPYNNIYNYSRQYPVNNINDTVFAAENHLYDLDTLWCYSDTTYYELGDIPKFEYINHAINHASNKCYRLLLQSKWQQGFGYPTYCNQNYFILKSKGYDSVYSNAYNPIEQYYKFPYPSNPNKLFNFFQRNNNSYYLTGNELNSGTNTYSLDITELDSNLQVIQTKNILHPADDDGFNLNIDYRTINNKNYFIAYPGYVYPVNTNNVYDSGFIWEYDTNFNALDAVKFTSAYQLQNYFSNKAGKHYFYFATDTSTLVRITDNAGDTIKSFNLLTKNKILVARDSSTYTLNSEYRHDNFGIFTDIFVYKWSKNGTFIKKTSLSELGLINLYDNDAPELYYDVDSFNNVAFGYYYNYNAGGSSLYYVNSINFFNLEMITNISGNISYDVNRNCQKDSAEISLKNVLVELQLNNRSFFTTSDINGNYRFLPYDKGLAKIILHLKNQSVYADACRDTFSVFLSDTLANPVVNFLLHTPFCNHPVPKVSVDISTPFLRRCFDNLYTLTLTNESNDTAFNTYTDVTLDTGLIATDTAFTSAENLGNHTYRFHFGTLALLQTIHKNLIVNVDCSTTILGQTHCVKAVSYPYERSCAITDGAYMQATTTCRNDSVIFTVKDIGYPQVMDNFYRVIVDDTVNYQGYLHFTMSNTTQTLSYYNPEGKTYRLETVQFPAYPNEDSVLSVSIEGCGNTTFSTGYITMFAQDDDQPNVSIDCHQNRGSYDPNDKSANPVGYNDAHLIENTQPITYTIHFQNLGTYAASFVTVRDTLSPALDITTLHVLGASSDYSLSIADSNILVFRFPDINLPAAADDSLLSNGFVKFSVKPKKNTAIGTAIHNNAYITFDYNEAVETNTVQHEIGKDFLQANLLSFTKNNLYNNIYTSIYPNPAANQFSFETSKELPKGCDLHFYTIGGKEKYILMNVQQQNIISVSGWEKGVYLFELKHGNEMIASGKIIVQ